MLVTCVTRVESERWLSAFNIWYRVFMVLGPHRFTSAILYVWTLDDAWEEGGGDLV